MSDDSKDMADKLVNAALVLADCKLNEAKLFKAMIEELRDSGMPPDELRKALSGISQQMRNRP